MQMSIVDAFFEFLVSKTPGVAHAPRNCGENRSIRGELGIQLAPHLILEQGALGDHDVNDCRGAVQPATTFHLRDSH